MPEDDYSLTLAIASGDTEAFARFYKLWFDFVYEEARRYSGRDEQFCLDVVQDVMVRVIQSVKPLNSASDVRRWLTVVVKTVCLDRLRMERRMRNREQQHAGLKTLHPAESSLDERISWLQAQLQSLPAEQVKLLTMRFRFNWTLNQIGQALGLKAGAVDGRISRTITTLRFSAQEELND